LNGFTPFIRAGTVVIDDIDLNASAILLDVDGTLLDIAAKPDEVVVPQRLRQALAALARANAGAVAFVSGRPLADLDRLFAPLKLAAVAGHGAELRLAGEEVPSRCEPPLGSDLRGKLHAFVSELDGIVLEDKGYSLALHYRQAPEHAETLRQAVAAARAAYPNNPFEVLPGKDVIEIKSSAFNKGTGIRTLMSYPPFRGRRPLFIGDDVTDQAAFAVLPEFGGIGFSVGHVVAGLAGCFNAPRDVRAWLYRATARAGVDRP
jgi:trehalose 6-phosphate phosphatase